jgi:hypothetical protein
VDLDFNASTTVPANTEKTFSLACSIKNAKSNDQVGVMLSRINYKLGNNTDMQSLYPNLAGPWFKVP